MGIQGSKQDQELEFIQETATGLGLAQDSLESKVCLLAEVTKNTNTIFPELVTRLVQS